MRFDFSSKSDQEKIQKLVKTSHAIIMGIPQKLQIKLGIDVDSLRQLKKPLAVVIPKASKNSANHLHDLNAMAMTGLLTLHAQTSVREDLAPPFLPIAGINFGHKMALDLLATMLKAHEEESLQTIESHLLEATQDSFGPFWPKELRGHSQFLHNGLYPCYNIYQSSDDHFIVMACIEEKFWLSFCEAFQLNFSSDQRFQTDGTIHKQLKEYFSSKTIQEVSNSLADRDICINILHRTDK